MNIEVVLSWVLRVGVLLSATLMCIGFIASPSILTAGVLVLAVTPLARVAMAGLLFLYNGERFFFTIALYVILILVISILLFNML